MWFAQTVIQDGSWKIMSVISKFNETLIDYIHIFLYGTFSTIIKCDWFFQYGTPCMPKSRGGIDFFFEKFKICPRLFLTPLTRFF
jgi:hypothetical protein